MRSLETINLEAIRSGGEARTSSNVYANALATAAGGYVSRDDDGTYVVRLVKLTTDRDRSVRGDSAEAQRKDDEAWARIVATADEILNEQNAAERARDTRALGFKHGGAVYLSDSFTTLRDKVLELGAHRVNGEPGTGVDIKKVVVAVDPEALLALSIDYALIDLDENLPTASLLAAAQAVMDEADDAIKGDAIKRDLDTLARWSDESLARQEASRATYEAYYPPPALGIEVADDDEEYTEEDEAAEAAALFGATRPSLPKELWIGAGYATPQAEVVIGGTPEDELTVGQLEATRAAPDHTPQVGDRITTDGSFPGWDGGRVVTVGGSLSPQYPFRVERKDGCTGLFAAEEVRVLPEPSAPGAFVPGELLFVSPQDDDEGATLDLALERVMLTVRAGYPVTIEPASNPKLQYRCFYVIVAAEPLS